MRIERSTTLRMKFRSQAVAALGATAVLLAFSVPLDAQRRGSVNYNPAPPPEVVWPMFVDDSASMGSPGTVVADPGVGRGIAYADVVGPDPDHPLALDRVGPPDGLVDIIQVNSNTPGLPLNVPPAQWVTPPIGATFQPTNVYRREPGGTYTNVTAYMGVTPAGFDIAYPGGSPWGVLPADYDGDGDLDLFFPCGSFNTTSLNALLRNDGGVFTNVTLAAGLVEVQASFGAAWLDYDGDGDLDLFVTNSGDVAIPYQGPPNPDPTDCLYRNEGDGTFTNVADLAGVNLRSASFSCTTSDLDRDGLTDLIVGCFAQFNKVFYNNGDGTFSFMAPSDHPWIQLDVNKALRPDPSLPGTYDFEFVPPIIPRMLPVAGQATIPVEVVDVNGDGWTDILFGVWSSQLPDAEPFSAEGAIFAPAERSYLYLNAGDLDGNGRGDGLFREVGLDAGFASIAGTMGLIAHDFDGDGFVDIYAGNGGPFSGYQLEEDLFFVSLGSRWPADFAQNPRQAIEQAFFEVGALAGTYANIFMAHGLMALPGDMGSDLIVANGGPAVFNSGQTNVYFANRGRSDGAARRSVAVELVPDVSPPAGLGSRVEVLRARPGSAARRTVLERRNSIGFTGASFSPLEFGLGDEDPLYASVTWTSGVEQGAFLLPGRVGMAPGTHKLRLEEPELSMSISREGTLLRLEVANTGSTPKLGRIDLEVLQPLLPGSLGGAVPKGGIRGGAGSTKPGAPTIERKAGLGLGRVLGGGWFLGAAREIEASVNLAAGARQRATFDAAHGPGHGLYRFTFLDPRGEVVGEAGVWYAGDKPVAGIPPGALAGQELDGVTWSSSMVSSRDRPSAPRPVLRAWRRIEVSADDVRLETYGTSMDVEVLDQGRAGRRTLEDGARIRWEDGVVEVRPSVDRAVMLQFEGDELVVVAGAPMSCCEEAPSDGRVQLLRLRLSDDTVRSDGAVYRGDGSRIE